MPREFFQGGVGEVADAKRVFRELRRSGLLGASRDLSVEVAQVLQAQTSYPSLVASGTVLLDGLTRPETLAAYDPIFTNHQPWSIRFVKFGNLAAFGHRLSLQSEPDVVLESTNSDRSITITGIRVISSYVHIYLSTTLQPLSDASLALELAKEASHPLFYPQGRRFLLEELQQSYKIPPGSEVNDRLFTAACVATRVPGVPTVSPAFDQFTWNLDLAGYGHIALDLAHMLELGMISLQEQQIMKVKLSGLRKAKDKSLIVRDLNDTSRFRWAEGVTPFDNRWFFIMRRYSSNPTSINPPGQ